MTPSLQGTPAVVDNVQTIGCVRAGDTVMLRFQEGWVFEAGASSV